MNVNYDDIKFLLAENEKMPVTPPLSLISEYAQNKRLLPPSTPFPGPWKNRRTPYSIEIMDNMGPFSPIQETRVMKAAQIGLTATSENVIAYWMDESPAEILYVSATESLLTKWATKRLEPLIDSCRFRNKIYAQTESKASRRTGDKIFSKEYVGGNLDMASSQSASSLRSDSKRILIIDEMDGAPPLLRTGEGNWVKVAMARTNAWGARKKILKFSTPTTFEASLINVEYEEGDQRKYLVPCPLCGKYQELKFGNEKTQYGIKAETVAGELKKAYYMCEFCHDAIFNHDKTKMLTAGRWEPTATSASKTLRSYHISALYSPVGMYSWTELYLENQNAQNDPDGMRSFVNLYLGLPFKESGSRPDIKKIIELRGDYRAGTVPAGVLYLTAGIDVQQGSKKDPNNPPRLEMEVLGIGAGYRTYSVLYRRFEGEVDDPSSGAWKELHEWAKEGGLRFKRKDGRACNVVMVFIDSGDGNLTDVVYRFTEQWPGTYPSKGFSALKKRKNEKSDVDSAGPMNFKRYRPANISGTLLLYEISTNYYKTHVYNNLKIQRQAIDPQRPGFCNFPVDYGEKYFKMLNAEEKRRDGSFFCPSGRRNEALDCFDEKTEVLTDGGWKFFYDLNKTEKVATVNLDTNLIEYQLPTKYIEKNHVGEMIKIKGRRIDVLVTPSHRMIASKKEQKVVSRKPYKRKWNLNTEEKPVLAKDLTIHHQLKIAANWNGKRYRKIKFNQTKNKLGTVLQKTQSVDSATWAAFLGIYISEGCKRKVRYKTKNGRVDISHRVQIDQNEGWKADEFRKIINELPWNVRESKTGKSIRWEITNKQAYEALGCYGNNCYNKKVSNWIKSSSTKLISLFLKYAIMGDGWIQTKENQLEHRMYSTVSKQLADDVQELFLKIGCASNIKKRQPKPYQSMNGKKPKNNGENVALQYHISECKSKKASLDGGVNGQRKYIGSKEYYEGKVYCVSVPNETLMLRRNGKSFIAGNCRVMALCAADVYLDSIVMERKALAKNAGATANELQMINHRSIIDMLKQGI